MSRRILVVDDERNIRRSLALILGGEGFDVEEAPSAEEALVKLNQSAYDAAFFDVMLPGKDGIELLESVRESHPELPVVMISGHATIERAVQATRLGAFDFIEKPFTRDRIVVLARNATESARLRAENAELKARAGSDIVGDSEVMDRLRESIAQVGPTDARVLILGESGTGKELVARALHESSPRAKRAFVKVNCAAIPDELIEAELFGAVKGAYTGATADRDGRFAAADGGTILLDEVGDMSLRAQVKVLRVLQEGEFEPVGSTKTVRVDVRVLAATHQDLALAVTEGRFREDLLYRLNVVPLDVAPLRERPGDIAQLAQAFLQEFGAVHGRTGKTLGPAARRLLESYPWPGNVRELKNVMERVVILSRGSEIEPADLPAEQRGAGEAVAGQVDAGRYAKLPLREAREALERDMIVEALRQHKGNVTRAAAELGLERTHLHKRIKTLGIEVPREG